MFCNPLSPVKTTSIHVGVGHPENMINLPALEHGQPSRERPRPDKTDPPSSSGRELSTTPQLGVRSCVPLPFYAGRLHALVFCRSHTGNHTAGAAESSSPAVSRRPVLSYRDRECFSIHLSYFMCVGFWPHVCLCITCVPHTHGGQKRVLIP